MTRRILLIGATGAFGERLARMLAGMAGVELVLAARGRAALEVLRDDLNAHGAAASLTVEIFDRTHPENLLRLGPWLVIDAAGPFQENGYALPLAAINAGAHYIDIADARSFVAGFPAALSEAARRMGVTAISGASSTPALSHAALEILTRGWSQIETVLTAISPGARAPRGLAVIQSILSYVGQPVRVWSNRRWTSAYGWSGLRRLDMPGLGRRWASICETPDLDLPARFPVVREALFVAGLEFAPMHLGLSLLGYLVRWRIVPSLTPLAQALRWAAGLLAPFGTDRGGMIVEASGVESAGRKVRARWSLWAEANAGPNTPVAPAAALVRVLINGAPVQPGAYVAAGLIDLSAILNELSALPIATRIDQGEIESPVLFRRLLGGRFDKLPPAVRAVHGAEGPTLFTGRAIARAGRSLPAQVTRLILGLPVSGRSEARVTLVPDHKGETWRRQFGSVAFSSRLVGTDRLGVFEEHFGPIRFVFDLQPTPTGVVWSLIGWRLLAAPLPIWLAPKVHARADEIQGRYRFRVAVAHPLAGLMFAYRGDLDPDLLDHPVIGSAPTTPSNPP